MSSEASSHPPEESTATTPLLSTTSAISDQIFRSRQFVRGPPSLRSAARFLRRAGSRRMLREPSMRVRETAAEEIEGRQSDWAYSRPVVILDLIWNLAFVVVSVAVLVMSRREAPVMPLRVWVGGYGLQCLVHMVCVYVEYKHRRRVAEDGGGTVRAEGGGGYLDLSGSGNGGEESVDFGSGRVRSDDDGDSSTAKHLESANTMFSFIWWIVGFYWVSAGGENLISESPQLYWLCITFLAFDVFFVVICVAVACVVGIAVCCCLPCIIAILYAVADQEGATKDDIDRLPKYQFKRVVDDLEKRSGEIQEAFSGLMIECDTDAPIEHALPREDAECCICLCAYDDGAFLRELPCCHHFHADCIDKWLYLNATCPLCKFNILKNGNQGSDDV
ncbi:hypothetical protein OSB04_011043 [Centaurea solstitialis]|uniref:RING-type E3 ubiquitin transferase n=1 Tax=Centaurea solstitialis TaxID=347529 RepID=A0AA38WNQ6_9ASTR|nr:hypothetical protein OSB04_011043 [Centaurea solstitialis]